MLDKRLKKHKLGYYEVKDKPSDKELNDYYSRKYYQEETGNYRKSYPTDEISHLRERVAQREFVINKIVKKENGKLLDVGCGEGIELQFFHEKGWDVEGIDFSLSGMENINPKMLEYSEKGNIYTNKALAKTSHRKRAPNERNTLLLVLSMLVGCAVFLLQRSL